MSENIFMTAESFLVSFFGQFDQRKNRLDVAGRLKEKKLTHLLARDELLIRFLRDNLDPRPTTAMGRFHDESSEKSVS